MASSLISTASTSYFNITSSNPITSSSTNSTAPTQSPSGQFSLGKVQLAFLILSPFLFLAGLMIYLYLRARFRRQRREGETKRRQEEQRRRERERGLAYENFP
jgi:hypothetical protein